MENLKFNNKKVAVLGMGMEGLALVDFLINKGCEISVLDKMPEEEIEKRLSSDEKIKFDQIIKNDQISKIFGDNYLDNLKSFDIIFRSPGVSYNNSKIQEAKENGTLISSQIKLFFDLCPCKIVGVTGTKGKGTTSSLIYEILKKSCQLSQPEADPPLAEVVSYQLDNNDRNSDNQQPITNNQPQVYLAGNIGYPAISLIPKLKTDDVVILELSSFQLMDLEKSPYIAVVTNLTVDHLDYHKDVDEYRGAKEGIIKFQNEGDFAVLNSESTFDSQVIKNAKSNIKYFGGEGLDSRLRGNDKEESGNDKEESIVDTDVTVTDDSVILEPKNRNIKICDLKEIKLFGHHNLENIAAATLVADILNVDSGIIKEVVRNFKGLPHRIEFVTEINGVKFINDSFATNPAPTMAAIDSFSENKILILGGSSKGADFLELAQKIAVSNIIGIILIGVEADKIEQALITASYSGQIKKGVLDINEIVMDSLRMADSGDVVIFSPACASFDMFKNYKDRGDKFKTAVLNLSQ